MYDIEHFGSLVMNIAHFLSHMTNPATVLHFVFFRATTSKAFVNASGLVGDTKQLHLPHLDGYLSVSVSDNLLSFA